MVATQYVGSCKVVAAVMMVLGGKLEYVVGTRLDSKVVLPAVTVKKSCLDSTQDA